MDQLARLVTRRPRPVLAVGGVLLVLALLLGAGAFGLLKSAGFEDPSSESSRARALLSERFGVAATDLVVLVTADGPLPRGAGGALVQELSAEPGVTVLADAFRTPVPGLLSRDGTRGLVLLALDGDDEAVEARAEQLSEEYTRSAGGLEALVGGPAQGMLDINTQVERDLARAEALAVPLTLALLLVVFGSVVAGLLPLLVGGVAIAGTFGALFVVASVTDVSIFALNLTTALGIGLGVDHALLVVSRFREELGRGRTPADAVAATLRTAGRTVLFSAATVAVSLSALLVFPLYFLRSFAYAGIAVVVTATTATLVLLPALLTLLGSRVDRGRVGRGASAATRGSGGWARLARLVMHRPVLTAAPVLVLLGVMSVPLAGIQFGVPDDRALTADVQARVVGDAVREDFDDPAAAALRIVLPALPGDSAGAVAGYAERLSAVPGVERVHALTATYVAGAPAGPALAHSAGADAEGAWLTVVPGVDPNSPEAERVVQALRDVPSPAPALVAGPSAELADGKTAIASRIWLAAGLVVLSTLVLLFLFTGSVVLPLKALVLDVVSLGAVLGAMVWVFQEGHGADLLGFTPTPISTAMPVLLFCIAFGLSMDYEVFLLGRIKEEHDRGASTSDAVAVGLERTGRVVTMAAVLLSITFFAFITSGVTFIQFLGLGTGLAIVLDATLVRGVLVPALMRVMGEANWWAPGPLRRLHARVGLAEDAPRIPAQVEPERVPAGV